MRRFFNAREKRRLWLRAAGLCEQCGGELTSGWHADHVEPYSQGGETALENGAALCARCNLRKGITMHGDRVELREWQAQWFDAVMRAVEIEQKVIVGNIHPGSGKTLAALQTACELWRMGEIDAVQVFVPRVNLCRQFETDWQAVSPLFADPKMGQIVWRNSEPLIRGGASGYVTTYAALMAAETQKESDRKRGTPWQGNPNLVVAQGCRTLAILDEAHQLGIGSDEESTVSARVVQRLAEASKYVFVLSGTVKRADGRRVLLARYSEPDERGMIYLNADVEATYKQGVAQGYLRPFEFQLCDGHAIHQYFDGELAELEIKALRSGLYRVLESPDFWRPMVDRWVEEVRRYQQNDRRLCGLIGCASQNQAQSVLSYLQKRHASFKALIAVSDEALAHDNLRMFKEPGWDGLTTVAMAHVGYDHKPIVVVLALTDVREHGWLDQFFARAMRECGLGLTMLALVPDDVRMVEYVESKRSESREGLKERERRITEGPGPARREPRLGYTTEVRLGALRAQGLEEDTHLNPAQLQAVVEMQQKFHLRNVAPTALAQAIRAHGGRIGVFENPPPPPPSQKTQMEVEKDIRTEIQRITNGCDTRMMQFDGEWRRGWANAAVKRQFGKERDQASQTELLQMLGWLRESYLPFINSRCGGSGEEQAAG